jgi:hypothetical protein
LREKIFGRKQRSGEKNDPRAPPQALKKKQENFRNQAGARGRKWFLVVHAAIG